MNVFVNDAKVELQDNVTLVELLNSLSLNEKKGIAVALNQKVVPKANWQNTSISNADRVTIITATQGG